jgi:hypothetical protein
VADADWTPAFEGQRPPLDGKEVGLETRFEATHGAYSKLRLADRATELVPELRDRVARYRQNDDPHVALLAITWARVEAAHAALEEATAAGEADRLSRLDADLRGWIRTARQLQADLGMTPTSRARLGLDVAQTARALDVTDLREAALELDSGDGEEVT